jgi:hypothetical protein
MKTPTLGSIPELLPTDPIPRIVDLQIGDELLHLLELGQSRLLQGLPAQRRDRDRDVLDRLLPPGRGHGDLFDALPRGRGPLLLLVLGGLARSSFAFSLRFRGSLRLGDTLCIRGSLRRALHLRRALRLR